MESPEATTPTGGLIDSHTVAQLLGITNNNLRQMVNKKKLVVMGRQSRRSLFSFDDVEELRLTREAKKARKNPAQG